MIDCCLAQVAAMTLIPLIMIDEDNIDVQLVLAIAKFSFFLISLRLLQYLIWYQSYEKTSMYYYNCRAILLILTLV